MFDVAQSGVDSVLRGSRIRPAVFLLLGLLGGLLNLQLFAVLHHLEQRVFQTGLAALQGFQLMLQFRQLFGISHRLQQRTVAILALTYPVDLGLEARHLNIQVFQRNLQGTQPVVRRGQGGVYPLDIPWRSGRLAARCASLDSSASSSETSSSECCCAMSAFISVYSPATA